MGTAEATRTIETLVSSRYSFLYLLTHEEGRWERELKKLGEARGLKVLTWACTTGVESEWGRADLADPEKVLDWILGYPERALFVLKDFHPSLASPEIVRKLRDMEEALSASGKTILFLSPVLSIPREIEKEVAVVDLPLPELEDHRVVLQDVLAAHARVTGKRIALDETQVEALARSVLGLTEKAAGKVLTRALLGRDAFHPEILKTILGEKRRLIRGSDLLEFTEASDTIESIGGLEELKSWLRRRSLAFSQKARRYNLPQPKGILLIGVQGCGKSLTARAVADLWKFPLVRLDMGAVLAAESGKSEENFRRVIKVLESIAPVVLWIDELEKAFAGAYGMGEQGTIARVLGTFVTWLQEKTSPVFVVATANRVDMLPPELLRKGRFDEFFFVDLPSFQERQAIFAIHLAKRGWNPAEHDLVRLSRLSEGYSGAEIEQAIVAAMYESFTLDRALKTQDVAAAMGSIVPLSVTMSEKVDELRDWARDRARPASPDTRMKDIIEEGRAGGELSRAVVLDENTTAPFRIVKEEADPPAATGPATGEPGKPPRPAPASGAPGPRPAKGKDRIE